MAGRELSDEALLCQLAAWLTYQAKGGPLSFAEWADTKDFAPSDRTFLEVAFMGSQMDQGRAS